MQPNSRFPVHPTTRYLVEWRRRMPSHEPMTLGALATADLACHNATSTPTLASGSGNPDTRFPTGGN